MSTGVRYLRFGENAILVEFGEAISLETNRKVIALDEALQKAQVEGIEENAPTYRSILVRYNPKKTNFQRLASQIENIVRSLKYQSAGGKKEKLITVPVVYGGDFGPDLEYVAQTHDLSVERVIKLHSCRKYRVYMLGFIAGFPYLGEVPDEIATPRLETPRLKIAEGSVGIAEKQTGIYPCEAPGGWRIIGRTPLKLFNPQRQPPALLKPGEVVKFKPVSENEFRKLASRNSE